MVRSIASTTLTIAVGVGLWAVPGGVQGQAPDLEGPDPIPVAEAHGQQFPRPAVVADLPETWDSEPDGTAERLCIDVPRGGPMTRSGEFVIGGSESPFIAGRVQKIWWKPLNSSLDMDVDFFTHALDGGEGEIDFNVSLTTFYTNDSPPQKIPEEAFFPSGTTFPAPGRWMVIPTSGENWGCFIFHVGSSTDAARGSDDQPN